jgi:RNA polymerase sigma-70 factor (ECF subfamily)
MKGDKTSFKSLVLQAKQGNREALNTLLEELTPIVRLRINTIANDWLLLRIDRDDLVNGALERIAHSLQGFEYRNKATFIAWVAAVSLNHVHQICRSLGAEIRNPGVLISLQAKLHLPDQSTKELVDTLPGSETTPSGSLLRSDRIKLARRVLSQLSDGYRQVLELRFFDCLTTSDIAQRLNKTEGAVRIMLMRAEREFRKTKKQIDPNSDY